MPYPVPMADTAGNILNRVAAEVGIDPVNDPYSSQDPTFKQLQWLLNIAGEELLIQYPWEQLQNSHQITTHDTDSGNYLLPTDFAYMIDQTGWERSQNIPLYGPLSPQDWTYLLGRDLVNSTLYASFRLKQGTFSLFPQPPPNGLDVNFEYVGFNWVQDGDDDTIFKIKAEKNNDLPLYNRLLVSRYLKVKYHEAKEMDSTRSQQDFNQMFAQISGQNMGAEILNAGGRRYGPPYLNTLRNTPDSGFGIA